MLSIFLCLLLLTPAVFTWDRTPHCDFLPDKGPCSNYETRYYYNVTEQECLPFSYGGCQGNSNNFKDVATCEQWCKYFDSKHGHNCNLTGTYGDCSKHQKRYFFNSKVLRCQEFDYSGCGGNGEIYKTFNACVEACLKVPNQQ